MHGIMLKDLCSKKEKRGKIREFTTNMMGIGRKKRKYKRSL